VEWSNWSWHCYISFGRVLKECWFEAMAAENGGFLCCIWLLQALLLLVLLFSGIAASQTAVTKLPGFDGDLPFSLETG
jgi:hypothetical protein